MVKGWGWEGETTLWVKLAWMFFSLPTFHISLLRCYPMFLCDLHPPCFSFPLWVSHHIHPCNPCIHSRSPSSSSPRTLTTFFHADLKLPPTVSQFRLPIFFNLYFLTNFLTFSHHLLFNVMFIRSRAFLRVFRCVRVLQGHLAAINVFALLWELKDRKKHTQETYRFRVRVQGLFLRW